MKYRLKLFAASYLVLATALAAPISAQNGSFDHLFLNGGPEDPYINFNVASSGHVFFISTVPNEMQFRVDNFIDPAPKIRIHTSSPDDSLVLDSAGVTTADLNVDGFLRLNGGVFDPFIEFEQSNGASYFIETFPGHMRFWVGGGEPKFRITSGAGGESLVLNSSGLHVIDESFRVEDGNGESRFRVTTGAAVDSLIVNSNGVTSKGINVDGSLRVRSADGDRFRVTTGAVNDSLVVDSSGVTVKNGLAIEDVSDCCVVELPFNHNNGQSFGITTLRGDAGFGNGGIGLFNNTSFLPFFIFDEAKQRTLAVGESGVGVGTFFPDDSLHIYADGDPFANAKVVVENDLDTTEFREMFSLINNGGTRFTMQNTDNNTKWAFAADPGGRFTFSLDNTGGPELAIFPNGRVIMGPGPAQNFDLDSKGNLTIAGTLSQSSDRDLKTAFRDVDTSDVLKRVEEMPISTWQFKFDDPELRHMGPTAQDFYSAFQLGKDEKTIAPVDGIGVSLAAIKALSEKVEHKEQRIQNLTAEVSQLRELLQENERSLEIHEGQNSSLQERLDLQQDRIESLKGMLETLAQRMEQLD